MYSYVLCQKWRIKHVQSIYKLYYLSGFVIGSCQWTGNRIIRAGGYSRNSDSIETLLDGVQIQTRCNGISFVIRKARQWQWNEGVCNLRTLLETIYLMAVMLYTCCNYDGCDIYGIVAVQSACWLLMACRVYGDRASAIHMMALASRVISDVTKVTWENVMLYCRQRSQKCVL